MDQDSKELLRDSMRSLSVGLDRMKEFDFSGAYSWFQRVVHGLQKLADKEKMNG